MKENPHILLAGCDVDSRVCRGVMAVARAAAWQLLVADPGECFVADWTCDGVVLAEGCGPAEVEAAGRLGVPAVLAFRADSRLPSVAIDDLAAGRLAARHYLDRSFRHFAWFSRGDTPALRLRERGFREECAGRGTYRAWFPNDFADVRFDAPAAARALARELSEAPKPLGVFCGDDRYAMLVVNACRLNGLALPEDVSILGLGNRLAHPGTECVTLSSVRTDDERVGREAAALLGEMLAGRRPPVAPRLLAPDGIAERQSTNIIGTDDPTLRRALNFIRESLAKPLGAAEVAAALGVARGRLDRLFAAELGRSVGCEVLRQRIALAKDLLAGTGKRLDEIARETGFCNPSYLIKRFRAATGLTPLEWSASRTTPCDIAEIGGKW